MEYVEGDTLAQRLESGRFEVEDALDVAKQMPEALEAAHEKGIIHRDLKPGNVMVTVDGKVKVLDFGLAKAIASNEDRIRSDTANSPTITARHSPTVPGVILGTAAYTDPSLRVLIRCRRVTCYSYDRVAQATHQEVVKRQVHPGTGIT